MVREGLRSFHALFFTILGFLVPGILGLVGPRAASGVESATMERRALWVPRYDFSTPATVSEVVALARSTHFNTLFVQAYARGEAYFRSGSAPRAGCVDSTFDPLAAIVQEGHRAGLEVHAWLNVYCAWSQVPLPADSLHVTRRRPEWFLVDVQGKSLRDYSVSELKESGLVGPFLSPANPEVLQYLKELVGDILSQYPVDGIHFDYFRYPSLRLGYEASSRTEFMRAFYCDPLALVSPDFTRGSGGDSLRLRELWDCWRTERVSASLRELTSLIRQRRPGVKVSCAVLADVGDALRHGQDWRGWLERGELDFVVPMAYSKSNGKVREQLQAALSVGDGQRICAGLGAYRQSENSIAQKIRIARCLGLQGVALFSYDRLARDRAYARFLQRGPFLLPARIPAGEHS